MSSIIANRMPTKRFCSITGCKNGVVQGGLCVKHGAKRRKCQFPGCDKNSKCSGLCSKHGPPRKKCCMEGCNNVSVQAGKCKSHGASSKKCEEPGCGKVAALNGMCKRHSDNRHAQEVASQAPAGESGGSLPVPGAGMSMSEYMQMAAAQNTFAAFHPISMMAMPYADPAAMSMMAQRGYRGFRGMGGPFAAAYGMGGVGDMYCGAAGSMVGDAADTAKPAVEPAPAADVKAEPHSEDEESAKEW